MAAAAQKAGFELMCVRKESEARIAAAASDTPLLAISTELDNDQNLEPLRFNQPPASYLSSTCGFTIAKTLTRYGLSAETRQVGESRPNLLGCYLK